MTLEEARAELFRGIAESYGLAPEQVEWVYEHLIEVGLIDYDIEKEILLFSEDDEE